MSYHVSFCSCVFSPFSIAITSLGEERANLSAFRTFVRFVLVRICRFSFLLSVWEGLRFVIVALPGLFSYLFLKLHFHIDTICSVFSSNKVGIYVKKVDKYRPCPAVFANIYLQNMIKISGLPGSIRILENISCMVLCSNICM